MHQLIAFIREKNKTVTVDVKNNLHLENFIYY